MSSKTSTTNKRQVWYCPCGCKTPTKLSKKFFALSNLIVHLVEKHNDTVEVKSFYRFKAETQAIEASNIGKKKSSEELDDGFKEIFSVEEEVEEKKAEEGVNELTNYFQKSTLN